MTTDVLCLVLGLLIGFGTGWFSYRGRQNARRALAEAELLNIKENFNSLQIEQAKASECNRMLENNQQVLQNEIAQERQFNISMHADLSRERANRHHLEQKLEHQKVDLLHLQQRLSQEFKGLVQQVLEEKSQNLTDLNKANLNVLLQPISDKLQDFKEKIEEQHYRETRELIVLHNKLANLESGRWNHNNSVVPPTAISNAIPRAVESAVAVNDPFIEYMPPSNESASASDTEVPMIQVAKPDTASEGDGYHSFSRKQKVEIDNFLKRTLGRAKQKKSAH